MYFVVAVENPHNRRIVDLENAVNRKDGEVAFSADFVAIRPVDAAKGNGAMLLEVPNRGHQAIVRIMDGGTPDLTKVGNAWLLRREFTVVSLGWQWDAPTGWHLNFGPHWRQTRILRRQPPKVGAPFPVMVPAVNADGNEMDGVRLPEITVPLATYTGWNLRDPSIGAPGQRVPFEGSYIPFPKTKADRLRTGDPRLSIAERYPGEAEYLRLYGKALDKLIAERWILPADKAAMMARGKAEWVLATE